MLAWTHGYLSKVRGPLPSESPVPISQSLLSGLLTPFSQNRIVRERIQTAWIMEDDADWDVMIKSQMTEFARGSRHIQGFSTAKPMRSPYGDGWDILFTGHCGVWNRHTTDQEYWVSRDDPTVVPPEGIYYQRRPNLSPPALGGNHTRIVFSARWASCLASYAVSLQGATRVLYDQAVLPNAQGIDSGLGNICRRTEYNANACLAVYPSITGTHRVSGDISRDSDRKNLRPGTMRKIPLSKNLVYPIRLNLGNFLMGGTVAKAQFPNTSLLGEIDTATFELPRGKPVRVRADEYLFPSKSVAATTVDGPSLTHSEATAAAVVKD